MSIRAVFRVQCDGPGKEWLSIPEGASGVYDLEAAPTAERAGNWPGEKAARRAALGAGWKYTGISPWNPEGQHATARGTRVTCMSTSVSPIPA